MDNRNLIAGIILAAGRGVRMGKTKQLLPINGIPMLQHVINAALASRLDHVIVVLGHASSEIREAVDLSRVTVVENPDYQEGQSSSLKAGLHALNPDINAALFLLADQPSVDSETINQLIDAYQPDQTPILRPSFEGKSGNPVLMDKTVFPRLLELEGDQGGRGVFRFFQDRIREVPIQHRGIHADLDTSADYQSFIQQYPDFHIPPTTTTSKAIPQHLLDVFTPRHNSVISFVGAGGKTTAIFTLARGLKEQGYRVLVTTTTAMYHPDRDGWDYDVLLLKKDILQVTLPEMENGSVTVAAVSFETDSYKIRGFKPELIDTLWQQDRFDVILVEADGSKGKPLKAPAAHEPVVPASTQVVFGLIGLNVLGKPLCEDWVHRSHLFAKLTGLQPNQPVTLKALKSLICDLDGLFKHTPDDAEKIVLLNGADTPALVEKGRRLVGSVFTGNDSGEPVSLGLVCRLSKIHPVLTASAWSKN
jgi:molybdenum cofactor cytidylyltransferase